MKYSKELFVKHTIKIDNKLLIEAINLFKPTLKIPDNAQVGAGYDEDDCDIINEHNSIFIEWKEKQ